MGHYVNPGSDKFQMSLNSEIYVDKSGLIEKTNALLDTERRFICISRPRRFGKTMAANMLAAYYGCGEDAGPLFENLAISEHPSYEKNLNQRNVIMINMQEFLSRTNSVPEMLEVVKSKITEELQETRSNPIMNRLRGLISKFGTKSNEMTQNIQRIETNAFIQVMKNTYHQTKRPFVILIDEWDCLFREYKDDLESQKIYLDFLRLWLKDQVYVGLAYMTGILPIKKYGTHSALNMFDEYSMTNPRRFSDYFGFKECEVKVLCEQYQMNIKELREWYNGYFVELGEPIYNPTSAVQSLVSHEISNYWNRTETYEALRDYIKLNFDGLKDKITRLVAGARIEANPNKFTNDMTTFNSADDVLALLIHLGYLAYCRESKTVRIPNAEVKEEFVNSIEDLENWDTVVSAIKASRVLLDAVWNMEADVVADGIAKVHEQNTSILQYNDENSLSCVVSLALYGANDYYTVIRELPTGKGYADLVFIPRRKFVDKPAIVVELKWNKDVRGAISQIKEKHYISALDEYQGNLLLVGINYDKKAKTYECVIEPWEI